MASANGSEGTPEEGKKKGLKHTTHQKKQKPLLETQRENNKWLN